MTVGILATAIVAAVLLLLLTGGNAALVSLTTDANGTGVTQINGGAVNTTGNQTYNDPVVLGANTVLTSTTNGDITFGGTLNGAYTLAVNTAGNSIFNGAVGGNARYFRQYAKRIAGCAGYFRQYRQYLKNLRRC